MGEGASDLVWQFVAPAYSFAVSQALAPFLRSLRQWIAGKKERQQFLTAIVARTEGLESFHLRDDEAVIAEVLSHPEWPQILIENKVDRASTIGAPLLVEGAVELRSALGVALVGEMQSRADPIFQALTSQTRPLDATFRASLDAGLEADWMPEMLLEGLQDRDVLADRDVEVAYLLYRWSHPAGYEVIQGLPFSGKSTLLAYCVTHACGCPKPGRETVTRSFASGGEERGAPWAACT